MTDSNLSQLIRVNFDLTTAYSSLLLEQIDPERTKSVQVATMKTAIKLGEAKAAIEQFLKILSDE